MKIRPVSFVLALAVCALLGATVFAADAKKPNILVIWGDDIGWYNPSIYNRGDMGYQTPNIDRIGKEGAMFTCWYGQQSCAGASRGCQVARELQGVSHPSEAG